MLPNAAVFVTDSTPTTAALPPTLALLTVSNGPVIDAPPDEMVTLPPIAEVDTTFNVFVFASPVMSTSAPAVMSPSIAAAPDASIVLAAVSYTHLTLPTNREV